MKTPDVVYHVSIGEYEFRLFSDGKILFVKNGVSTEWRPLVSNRGDFTRLIVRLMDAGFVDEVSP